MLMSLRLLHSYKYYKQIAELVGVPIYTINDDIVVTGDCILYDNARTSYKSTTVEEARQQALTKDQDLLLIKQGLVPSLQIKPYVYEIYRNFIMQLKRTKATKTIPLKSRIMQHDINNKLQIARRLFKKGHGTLRLLGNDDSEDNKKVLERFVKGLGNNGDADIMLQKLDAGKNRKGEEIKRWVGYYQLREFTPHVNYHLLDKRFMRMTKKNITLDDVKKRNSQPLYDSQEESEEESDELEFSSRKEGQQYFFRLVSSSKEEEQPPTSKQKQDNENENENEVKQSEVEVEGDEMIAELAGMSPGMSRELMANLMSKGSARSAKEAEKLRLLSALEEKASRRD